MISFLETKVGTIIISVILGLGLSTLFKKACKGSRCIVINSPAKEKVDDTVFKYKGDKTCYKYDSYITKCNKEVKETIQL